MEHNEYPKMLYGPKGWGDLNDCRLVSNAEEEEAASEEGYGPIGELPEEGNPAGEGEASGDSKPARRGRKPAGEGEAA